MVIASSISGLPIYAPSAAFAPTNSADVSAIASAYQVVSSTATQLYAGTAYVTSINEAPVSAARAGNAANASLANSAWYDGTGRLISALPDSAAVSAIASAYAESAASGKQDTLTFGYDENDRIDAINGSALAGQGGGVDSATVSAIASSYAESAVSSVSGNYYTTANESGFITAQAQASWSESASASPSYIQDKPDLVDIVAGPGIVVDNPDGNTLRVSMAADYEVELYYSPTNHNVATNAEFAMSESIWNFSKVLITFDNMEFENRTCTMLIDLAVANTGTFFTTPYCNGDTPGIINIAWASFNINATGNIKYLNRGLIYGTWTAPAFTTGTSRGYRVKRVVGINRIANN